MLFSHILDGAEILIPMPQVPVGEVEVSVFRNCNAAVSQNAAECVDIHTIH